MIDVMKMEVCKKNVLYKKRNVFFKNVLICKAFEKHFGHSCCTICTIFPLMDYSVTFLRRRTITKESKVREGDKGSHEVN